MEEPQVNMATGNQAQAGNGVGWQGMTIKDILEKVDLFNLTTFSENTNDEDVKKLKDIKTNLTTPDVNWMVFINFITFYCISKVLSRNYPKMNNSI